MISVILFLCIAGLLAIVPFFRLLNHVSKRRNRLTAAEVADRIERHILGTEGLWDWDDFTSIPIADEKLDAIRIRCSELDGPTPISEEKREELKRIVERLRNQTVRLDDGMGRLHE
jgi:hypothetical protein